jgi:hypothetical protein
LRLIIRVVTSQISAPMATNMPTAGGRPTGVPIQKFMNDQNPTIKTRSERAIAGRGVDEFVPVLALAARGVREGESLRRSPPDDC